MVKTVAVYNRKIFDGIRLYFLKIVQQQNSMVSYFQQNESV